MQPNWREGRATAEAPGQQPLYLEARGLGACHPHLFTGQKDHLQGGGGGQRGGGCTAQSNGGAEQQGGHKSGHDAVTTVHTHKSRPPGPPQRASRLHSCRFFPLPPQTTELQTRHQQGKKDRKAESKADPTVASPAPPGLLSGCFQQLYYSENHTVCLKSLIIILSLSSFL